MSKETQQVGRLHSSPLQLYKREVVQYGLLRVHFNHCSRHWLNDCHKKELTAHVYQTKRLAYQPWRGDALRCLSFCIFILADLSPFFKSPQRWLWKMAALNPTHTLIHNKKEYSALHTEYSSNVQNNGRNDKIWTCGLFHPKEALYQAELRPEQWLLYRPFRILSRNRR